MLLLNYFGSQPKERSSPFVNECHLEFKNPLPPPNFTQYLANGFSFSPLPIHLFLYFVFNLDDLILITSWKKNEETIGR